MQKMQRAKPSRSIYVAKQPPATDSRPALVEAPLTVEQAFRRYASYVAVIAFRMLGRDEQIDDVVQDVFMVAIKHLDRLRDPGAAKGWLATITVRCASRRLRLRRLRLLLGLDRAPRYEDVVAPAARLDARILLGQIYALLVVLRHPPAVSG